mmetsp:Transcript_39194/g.92416  ORF Transcript_39194/g.92416 Transcript_39194/m.92416 type:complete len:225 (+) Transcript_39194:453-1127(+)
MGRAGFMAAASDTKCCALSTRIAAERSSCRLSLNAPNSLRASSGVRRWTMATTFATAISRTDSCRSVESSLKRGTSSLTSTSFSITFASAGIWLNAALRTMGISSLASVSYCLRRVGRSAGGEDGYTDAKRPAALMREGKFSPPASRFTSGNISFCTRSSPIAAATVTSDATAFVRTMVSSFSARASSEGSSTCALSPPPIAGISDGMDSATACNTSSVWVSMI